MIEGFYILVCILLAFNNSKRIRENKKIYHWLNGSLHLIVAGVSGWFIDWIYFPVILLTARIFFDSALNYFRGLSLFYVTPTPKSFQDKAEQKIFGRNGKAPLLIYFILWIIANYFLWFMY